MAYTNQKQLGLLSGYATTTSCKVVVVSLYPGDVTVTCADSPGSPYTVALSACGDDRPSAVTFNGGSTSTACYVGSTTITGLPTSNTRYAWSATQSSRSESSYLWSAPSQDEDAVCYLAGCHRFAGNASNNTSEAGSMQFMDDPLASHLIFVDDFMYHDVGATDDSVTANGGTGHVTTAVSGNFWTTENYKYNYALCWCAWLGLLGDVTSNSNFKFNPIKKGRNTYMRDAIDRMNLLPQWGDHEFKNNMGYDSATNILDDIYIKPKTVWDQIMLPLQPPCRGSGISSADAVANHWAIDLGPMRIVAPDRITRGNGTAHVIADAETNALWGADQITDLRNALNVASPAFKVLASPNTLDFLWDASGETDTSGINGYYLGQEPLRLTVKTEYRSLVTSDAVPSVMNSNYTNGNAGCFIWAYGDWHNAIVSKLSGTAYAGNLAEEFYHLPFGPVSSDGGQVADALVIDAGTGEYVTTDNGFTIEQAHISLTSDGVVDTNTDYVCLKLYGYGSENPPRMKAELLHRTGVSWNRQWVQYYTDNLGAAVDAVVSPKVGIGVIE